MVDDLVWEHAGGLLLYVDAVDLVSAVFAVAVAVAAAFDIVFAYAAHCFVVAAADDDVDLADLAH